MAPNDWFAQFLADMMALPVGHPANHETTARGAALPGPLTVGIWPDLAALKGLGRDDRRFESAKDYVARQSALSGWRAATAKAIAIWPTPG